jgi:hypothetical protein
LRLTPTDRAAELSVARRPVRQALEARVRFAADGAFDSVKVRGSLATRTRVRLSPGSSDGERDAAAAKLRYNPTKGEEVRQLARVRGWRAGDGGQRDIHMAPSRRCHRLQPVWTVQVNATRSRTALAYVVTLDATDGSLIEVKRGSGQ